MSKAEASLWAGVINQALEDATTAYTSKHKDLDRQVARSWFRRTNPDFIEVCNLAGLDPDAVHERALVVFARYDAAVGKSELSSLVSPSGKSSRRGREPRRYTHDGESLTLREWSARCGVTPEALSSRLRNYTMAQALNPEFKAKSSRQGQCDTQRSYKGRAAKLHTINDVSKTLRQWAEDAGISYVALMARLSRGASLADALAMPKGRWSGRGVGQNLEASKGTGAGSVAQEMPNLGISE